MSALERTFEWRRVIDPRTLVPSVIFSYAVTYDLRDLWLTQVIRDVIGDDPEVRGRKIVFHSKVLTKTDILVYYMSQSVQNQQRCGLKCRSRVPSDAKTRNLRIDTYLPHSSVFISWSDLNTSLIVLHYELDGRHLLYSTCVIWCSRSIWLIDLDLVDLARLSCLGRLCFDIWETKHYINVNLIVSTFW